MRDRLMTAFAGLNGACGVAAAAYGAHAPLSAHAADLMDKASRYQLIHAVAVLALLSVKTRTATIAAAFFAAGILLFCGGLYATALLEWPPRLVPIGGTSFIVGWLVIAVCAIVWGRSAERP